MKKLIGKDTISRAGGMAAGAVGSGFIIPKIPVGDDKMKNGIGAVIGFLGMGQKGMIGNVAAGMFSVCAANLGKSFGIGGTIIGNVEDVIIDGIEFDEDPPFEDERYKNSYN